MSATSTLRIARVGLLLLALGLLAACEDPNRQPKRPGYLDLEVEQIRNQLPWPEGSAGGTTLADRLTLHGAPGVAIGLVDGGELRHVVVEGRDAAGKLEPTTLFEATPLADAWLTLGLRRLEQRPATDEKPAFVIPPELVQRVAGGQATRSELARLLGEATGRPAADWLNDQLLRPALMRHSQFEGGADDLRFRATVGDLALYISDLQKAQAGKPNRRLARDMARAYLKPLAPDADGVGRGFGLDFGGKGHGAHFTRRALLPEGAVAMIGFVSSGQGAVVVVTSRDSLPLAEEVIAGLARQYNWPAFGWSPVRADAP
jgi:hypothetical protein